MASSLRDGDSPVSAAAGQSPHLPSVLAKLRPFQRKAFEFAVHGIGTDEGATGKGGHAAKKAAYAKRRGGESVAGAGTGRILLGDEMGLGKTLSSLAIMLAYQQTEWPLLILCPASLRYTWPAEIERFCPFIPSQSIHVVRGKDDVHFAVKIHRWRKQQREIGNSSHKKCPVQIVIVTYSLLQNRFQIANTLRECEFECIIADESHNLKQLSSQRCQLALPLLQGAKRLVLLSGTPALNRPVELWPQLHALDAKGKMFGEGKMSYTQYTKRYCNAKRTRFGWDVKGVSNAHELHQCLKSVMMRRLKADVLQDLPSKQRSIVPVTLDKERERESRDTMMQLGMARQALSEITDLDADDVANSAHWESKRLLMQAYQASGVAKAPATTEYILDWLEGSGDQKLVVFAHHKEVLDYIETTVSQKYKGRLGMMRIDGSVPPAERALHVKKFQTNKSVRLALLSMTAAGVGLTLTAASNIIFAELHWTPGVLAQAEDRCHRIGQHNSVNVMYCICKDEEASVDTSLWSMLGRKVGALGRVVDGEKVSLNAVEKDASIPSDVGKKGGFSVEEELSSFFSSESPKKRSKQKNAPVVRGSIQSFFKKQAKKSEPGKGSTSVSKTGAPKSDTTACISLLDDDMYRKNASSQEKNACISLLDDDDDSDVDVIDARKEPAYQASLETKSETAVFICHKCTFENEADAAACAVCLTPRAAANEEAVATKENEEGWACSFCTFINQCEMACCEMCTKQRQPAQTGDAVKERYSASVHSGVDAKPTAETAGPVCEEDEFDDDDYWNEADLAAIDLMTQSHARVSQSPESTALLPNSSQRNCMSRECAPKHNPGLTDVLSFSVSKNSGRIALHLSSSGQPLHVNFDLSQVLTKESAELLEEANLQRTISHSKTSHSEQSVTFDDGAIQQVLDALDDHTLLPAELPFRDNLPRMCKELKGFVRCYLDLREVEKKAVRESGQAIPASHLKHTVAKLLVSTVTGSTERYLGGAKERAIANLKNDCATAEDMAVIRGRACAWCAKPVLCSDEQRTARNRAAKRDVSEEADGTRPRKFGNSYSLWSTRTSSGVCTLCGIDAHALFCRIKALHPAERLNALLNAKWKLPQTRQATDRLLSDPKESDFWQADHALAVAEGGGSTGLDNLRTLCTPCHGYETEKLLSRLKTLPNATSDENARDGRTQMDIMSCFSKMNGDKSTRQKKKKRRRLAD